MDTIKLSIVTPSGEIFNDEVKAISLPGKEGEFGVLPHHSVLVSLLDVGIIEIETVQDNKEAVAINWGYVKVKEDSVSILVDGAVALHSKGSDISLKIDEAKKLVNSVQDTNISMAAINSKLHSFN